MGGIETAVGLGVSTANLLNRANQSNKELKQMQKNYQYNQQKRKNLLEAQLANRRASLSSMGLGASKSALAAQQRELKEGNQELKQNQTSFEYNYKKKYEDKDKELFSGVYDNYIGNIDKILK